MPEIETARPYRDLPPVVYYGSSITQGVGVSRPGNCYEAMISRRFHLDFINLGFSGNARGRSRDRRISLLAEDERFCVRL